MILPYLTISTSGLRRTGPATWRALDEDPHFKLPLRLYRPRHLIVVLDGIDRPVTPTVFLDRGEGFTDTASARFLAAGRFVCRFELSLLPGIRRIRIDPLGEPGLVRCSAWATDLKLAANLFIRRLVGSRVPTGPTRIFTVREPSIEVTGFGSGLERRNYRNAAEHFAEVTAMPRGEGALPAGPRPLLSFLVPTYDTEPAYLDALLRSVRDQAPGLAELVFSDDGSSSGATLDRLRAMSAEPGVQVVLAGRNGGIAAATNAALARARAPWVSMLDHDDALAPGAVELIARTLAERPDATFLYTDEVVARADLAPADYLLKPAYDPVLLSGVNYVNHLSVYRTERLRAQGGLRDGFQGSQDYDCLLRYLDGVAPGTVVHLPYPAYLWRRHEASFSTAHEVVAVANARKALGLRYGRPDAPAPVEPALSPGLHRVRFDLVRESWPALSVVIPNRDSHDLLAPLLRGLTEGTDYPGLDIVVVDNGSTEAATLALYDACRARLPGTFSAEIVPEPFNFSRAVNRGVARARGELVLLLNNDVEVLEPGWLKEMASCFAYEGTGIVGARLLYPDRTLQHAGVIVGAGGLAGHWFDRSPESAPGPMGRLGIRQTMTAVTGAAMLVSRRCLREVGPWDEERFGIAYNDVDFCLRAREAGFRTVWTPFATLIHHESASRGSDRSKANSERYRGEQNNLRARHGTGSFCDPATNPWHTRDRAVPGLRALDRLPRGR